MLSREELKDESKGLCLTVKKQRNGPLGNVYARFYMEQQRIVGLHDEEREVSNPYAEKVDTIEDEYEEGDDLF